MENCFLCGKQFRPQAVPLWLIEGTPPAVVGKAHSGCHGWGNGPGFKCATHTKEQALAEYLSWKERMSSQLPFFYFRVETDRGRVYVEVEAEDAKRAMEKIGQFFKDNPLRGGIALTLKEIILLKNGSTGDAQISLFNGGETGSEAAWRMLGLGVQYDVLAAVERAEGAPTE